jgi:hypothetical protein
MTSIIFINTGLNLVWIPSRLCAKFFVCQGIRYYRDLEFTNLMKPFGILSSVLQELERNGLPGETGENRGDNANVNDQNNDNMDNTAEISGKGWWNNDNISGKGWWNLGSLQDENLSEVNATNNVAMYLYKGYSDVDDRGEMDERCFQSFFRHHFQHLTTSDFDGSSGMGRGVDLGFARIDVTPYFLNVEDPDDALPFPSAEAWGVARFQLSDAPSEGFQLHDAATNALQTVPKFGAAIVAGFLRCCLGGKHQVVYDDEGLELRPSVAEFLRIVGDLVGRFPDLLPEFCSWPRIAVVNVEEGRLSSPLKHALFQLSDFDDVVAHLGKIMIDLLTYSRARAMKSTASEADLLQHRHHKELLVSMLCQDLDEERWTESLSAEVAAFEKNVARTGLTLYQKNSDTSVKMWLSVLRQVQRDEGTFLHPVRGFQKLTRATVCQMDM